MFCKFCGKEIEDNAKFCAYCGKEVKSGENTGEDSGRQERLSGENSEKTGKFGKPEKSRKNVIWYVIAAILILAAAAVILFFAVRKPKTESEEWDSEISSDREEDREEEAGEESDEEEPAAEEVKATSEQIRASLENALSDLEAQYGYADTSPRSETFDFKGDYSSKMDSWNMWTNLYGIVKAEICDLDGDGQEELFVILIEGKDIHLCVYEVDEDQPFGAPVKRAEVIEERSGDIHNHEDVCTKVDGDAAYLLFMQAYWGGWGDGYYGQVKLYRYDGTNLYTPLTVQQEGEASSEFVYLARQYEADGTMLSEKVIYDDAALYGTYMDEDYCRGCMKELFGAYGISIGDRATVHIYDGSFDGFLASGQSSEELMKLRMWSDIPGNDWESLIFYFDGIGHSSISDSAEMKADWNDARAAYLAHLEEQGAFDPFISGPGEGGDYAYNYFSLDYVDGDDIPELIYGQGYMNGGDGEHLLSFHSEESGERNSINIIEAEFVEYIEGTGMVDAQYGHNYARENNIWQLKDGEFEFLESGNYEDGSALDDGEDDWLDGAFAQWEGKEVTKKEYAERWMSVYAGKGERTYEKHNYTPEEMREILQTPRTAEELKVFLESDI